MVSRSWHRNNKNRAPPVTYCPRWTFQLVALSTTYFSIPTNFLASSPVIGAIPATFPTTTNSIWITLCWSSQSYQHQRQTPFYMLSCTDFCHAKQHLLLVLRRRVVARPTTFPASVSSDWLTKPSQFRATSFAGHYFPHFCSRFLFLSLNNGFHCPVFVLHAQALVFLPDALPLSQKQWT